MREYLTTEELDEVLAVVLDEFGLDQRARILLFRDVMREFVLTLPRDDTPFNQFESDLTLMNRVERLVDGSVPLRIWLRNAERRVQDLGHREVLRRALDTVTAAADGQPDLGDAVRAAEDETHLHPEKVIFRDDTLAFGFLAGGAAAGRSVARVLITPHCDSVPTANRYAGTCWLLANDLVITNHHVVNARRGSPAPQVADADFATQASSAIIRFDFDTEDTWGAEIGSAGLVAASRELDYAVLRLAEAPGRPPLPLVTSQVVATLDDNMAVNVIQHPEGGAKRLGLRNNLVNETTETDVRYFTDTHDGASGSPVFTDDWKVCALHKGARLATTRFQGKSSIYVNVGTQIAAVLDDLRARHPAVHEAVMTSTNGGQP
ncbi:trypsin-like peptidase domain-containing protein [Amycolatopsis sp. A133]|uniref:trypsin-like peptidase domain-containing protein n=1 Tax=Amycolatopsis sp. A133 TaxID=3064472 RepID=UPI0027F76C42|nr:trypsin-like peptidase domain-containing protein [Amycolatopsis sp. A133]MDQ7802716.1 trypsin-like peptidase domain-containing protein [Amycolatopsis sp. A133]